MFSMLVSFHKSNYITYIVLLYCAKKEKGKEMQLNFLIFLHFLDDPTEPDLVLQPPHFMVSCEYNQKDPNIIAGGCYNGQVIDY